MTYQDKAKNRIRIDRIPKTPRTRLSDFTKDLMKKPYVIDVHSHIFDIRCVNKSYFITRFIKDFLGVKSNGDTAIEFSMEDAYKNIQNNDDNWEEDLIKVLQDKDINFVDKQDPSKGFIDSVKAIKYLTFTKMIDVYNHYIKKFSLAKILDLPKENILATALTMDLEMGWGVKLKKPFYNQIEELKELSESNPVLPFLYCDPRRADIEDNPKENLYSLFDYAFAEGQPFFGVKIYPALGYDPSDYRLWPIFEICEKLAIPVLTHCGGNTISTDQLTLDIFEGDTKKTLTATNRKEMADSLNNPKRWKLVMEKFPNLKLDLGHFGGYETWGSSSSKIKNIANQQRKEFIFGLMEKYPNVYADFSYNFVEDDLSDNLINILVYNKTVREKTLFGSDYWVVTPKGNLRKEQFEFIEKLRNIPVSGLDLVNKLVLENPKKYLFE